jgi:hypothetical protein
MSVYLNNIWKPVKHTIFIDDLWAEQIHNIGYKVLPLLNNVQINQLTELFKSTHTLDSANGGMFYSIYSQDIKYRQEIHKKIGIILAPTLEKYFLNYKMVLNSFVAKLSGPKSEFYLHQDTTALDESKYSPLSLWIPLQDVDEDNGCLGVIPYSHFFFTPYRSISFPAPFDNIQSTAKQYLYPVAMKAGEVLIFDNRVLHHSYHNISNKSRIAVICGLFPEEAKMITCHKPEYKCGGKVELLEHEDDFLLTGKNFLIDCQKRPETGKSLSWVDDPYPEISVEDFEKLCKKYWLTKTSDKELENTECEMIGEPI